MDKFTIIQRKMKNFSTIAQFFAIVLVLLLPLTLSAEGISGAKNGMTLAQQIKTTRVTLDMQNKALEEILVAVCKQAKVLYVVKEGVNISDEPNYSLKVNNKTVALTLDELLSPTVYDYTISDNKILIVNRPPVQAVQQQQEEEITIQGTVKTSDGKLAIGATVLVEGDNTKGCITDADGKFVLTLKSGSVILVSYTGYLEYTQTITKTTPTQLVITLQVDEMAVEDVVVTGIFERPRESYTGSVTTITEKEIKMFRGQNLLQTIANIDPALNIVQNNEYGSDPNRVPEVNIRGNSSLPASMADLNDVETNVSAELNVPYIIMDGFPISLERLMEYDDEEIASINILKDASATAIYGSRGANGVIVVTSKVPQEGKLKVFVQTGITLEMPDLTSYNLLNAREKLDLEKRIGLFNTTLHQEDKTRLDNYYNSILRDINSGVDTYWLSQAVRTGVGQRYNTRLEGGSKQFRWGVSLNYNQTIGAMEGSKKDVFNGSITLTYTHKKLTFRNQLTTSFSTGDNGNYGSFSDYAKMNPYWKIYEDDGHTLVKEYARLTSLAGTGVEYTNNPLYNTQFNSFNYTKSNTLTNNFSIDWKILPELTLRGRVGVTQSDSSSDKYVSGEDTSFKNTDLLERGSYDMSVGDGTSINFNTTLSYSKVIAEKHSLYAGVDFSISQSASERYGFRVIGFTDDELNFFASGSQYPENAMPSGSESLTRSVGLTSNINYTFDNRFFVDGSFRVDGASQYGRNNRFAPFYSIGAGWNVHREDFLKNVEFISSLRIRGSYGISGSQNFGAYDALTIYKSINGDRYGYWGASQMSGIGNENLTWQTTGQANGGFELKVLKSRLSTTIDVYKKTTVDLISRLDTPGATGFTYYSENIGEVKNTGLEASVSGTVIRNLKRNIIWTLSAKIAHNVNEVVKLSDAMVKQNANYLINNPDNDTAKLIYVGDSQNSIYTVPSLGIDPSTGRELFLGSDGLPTYTYDAMNREWAGTTDPKYRGSLNSTLQYKGLSFNLSFGYHWGGQQENTTVLSKIEVGTSTMKGNVDKRVYEERWQEPGDISLYKGFSTQQTRRSSRIIQDDNVFRLNSANLAYRFDTQWLKEKLDMQSLTVSANMSDLFYIGSIQRERGTTYPFARNVQLSLSLMF